MLGRAVPWRATPPRSAAHRRRTRRPRRAEYSVAVSPELPSWSQCEPECIRLQTLDLRNIQVIAQVLAQSVALDFYSR
jgi:hypothetical protein